MTMVAIQSRSFVATLTNHYSIWGWDKIFIDYNVLMHLVT